jgi:hypothetical protein
MKGMRMHIEGLKKLVAVRGGFEKLRISHPEAACIAMWCVLFSFIAHALPTAILIRLSGFRFYSL